MMTAQTHIVPIRRERGSWYIDDPAKGMAEQQLAFGMDQMLDKAAKDLPGAGDAFLLHISDGPQRWQQGLAEKVEADANGYWYSIERYNGRGWLSEFGLGKYFESPPDVIYYRFERDGGQRP